ncbi:MAG: MFS transporter [Devosia sp.]
MIISSGRQYYWRLAALSLAMLLPSLGTSIANVALPTLAASFEAPFHDVQWVVVSYLLAITTLIVSIGRLGDLLGRRRLLLVGIGLFAAASVASIFSPNLGVLIATRTMQGIGAAIMMALTIALVRDAVSPDRTGSAMGLLGTVSAVGTALGPSLGGLLISWSGWQAVFAFMAIIGTLTFFLGQRLFPADAATGHRPVSSDIAGTLLLAVSLGSYSLSATLGGAAPGPMSAILLGMAAIGIVAFVVVESRSSAPLIQLERLRDASLGAGLVAMALVSTIMMATLVVGPFYLSQVLRLSPVWTGLVMSIGPIVAALTGIPAGRMVDQLGPSVVTLSGLGGVVAGSALMAVLPASFGVAGYVGSLALITAGYALFQAANNTAIMDGATKSHRGVTSALLGLSRNLGLVTGASVMGAVFAFGSRGAAPLGLDAGGASGMTLTFGVATVLAVVAFVVSVRGHK